MYRLVSFKLCPYVQRCVIALEERGAPYEVQHIDLYRRPDWFSSVSPLGKVPVLVFDGVSVFESSAISELIDETAPGEPLLPREPLRRAVHRGWIEVTSELLREGHALALAPSQEAARAAACKVVALLEQLEGKIGSPGFDGERFSLVDVAAAPALQRLTWCQEIAPSLNLFESCPRVRAWRDALLDRGSVRRSTVAGLPELFIELLRGRGSPHRSVEPSWLGRLSLAG